MEKSEYQTSTSSQITGLLLTNHLIETAMESQPKWPTFHIRLVHSLYQFSGVVMENTIFFRSTSFTYTL